jgi:glyoxylase I family protein
MDARYAGISHISFSVTDLDRSKRWYAELFGWEEVMAGEDADSRFAVGAMTGDFLFGLRQHSVNAGDRFDPRRTGLDHAALAVAGREQLSGWEQRLAASGITYSHSGVRVS